MQNIPLLNQPAQEFTVALDDNRWTIRLKEAAGCMSVDISKNDDVVFTGMRALANTPVIPFTYLEDGNFLILTVDDALPDWTQFGSSQTMVYISPAEIAAIMADG